MIITLLFISVFAGFAAAWASREVSVFAPMVIAGIIWVSGVFMINKGIEQMSAPLEEPSDLISLGMITVITGLAISTSLALGRIMRGKVKTPTAGIIGAVVTLLCMGSFYIATIGA